MTTYRVKYEGPALEPTGEWDVFDTKVEALHFYRGVVAAAWEDLASVYVTEQVGDDEVVILGRCFAAAEATAGRDKRH
jgi:hypothetical protein